MYFDIVIYQKFNNINVDVQVADSKLFVHIGSYHWTHKLTVHVCMIEKSYLVKKVLETPKIFRTNRYGLNFWIIPATVENLHSTSTGFIIFLDVSSSNFPVLQMLML